MGMQLPPELRKALEYIGVDWPASDESVIEGWAPTWRTVAGELREHRGDLDDAVKRLADRNEGDGLAAFQRYAGERESASAVLGDAASGADLMATACEATAAVVVGFKGLAIANLISLAAAIAAAVAAEIGTAGIGTPFVAGALALARKVTFDAITTALSDAAAALLAGDDATGTGGGGGVGSW